LETSREFTTLNPRAAEEKEFWTIFWYILTQTYSISCNNFTGIFCSELDHLNVIEEDRKLKVPVSNI